MRARSNLILALVAAAALLAGGCQTTPYGEYGRYDEPEPLRLDLMLEGLAQIALFGLSVWAGYEYYHDGYHGHYSGHHYGYPPGHRDGYGGGYRGDHH